MKKSILFSVLVVGATLLQAQSITVHQTCGQNGQVLVIETNGHECVDLGLPSGTLWATCNVGATTPEDYGDYFAWGETAPKATYDWGNYFDTNDGGNTFTKYNNNGGKTVLDPEDDAARVHWGGSWRMPTKAEWKELYDNCTWKWTTQNGIKGYKVTSNKAGYTDKFIFLPAAGYRRYSGLSDVGSDGSYWSSSLNENISYIACGVRFGSGYRSIYNGYRSDGQSVRPVLLPSYSTMDDTIRIYSNGCDDYQTFIGPHGSQLTMTANSDQWSHFVRWNDGNTDNPRTITTNGNANYTAYFEAAPCLLASGTCGAQGDNLTWELSCDSVLTISGTGAMTDYSYSSSAPWYSSRSSITSVIISDGVTSIGNAAFRDCSGLTSVTIPNSVTSIGNYAFSGCSGLTSVTIPNSVTSIGEGAFVGCSSLTSVTIPNSVTSIGYGAFEGCSSLTSVTIPNSVTSIGDFAFKECSSLTSVTIPNSVTSIGEETFAGCSGLTSVTIGNSVTSIGDNAFYNCISLTSVTIPSSVTSIGGGAFRDCSGLTAIYVPCGEMERFKQMLNNDSRINDHAPLPYTITINAINGTVAYPQTMCDDMQLTATPYNGYHFVKWSDGNTDNPRTFELTCDTIFTAIFEYNQCTLSLQCDENQGSVEGAGVFDYLAEVQISATPAYGYHFSSWSDGNTANPRTYSVTKDVTLTANFAPNKYALNVSCNAEQGSVTGSGSYNYLSNRTIEATPNYGYHFKQWSDGNTDNPRTIELRQDTTLEAIFAVDKYGTCGDNLQLTWRYDTGSQTLTISGEGDLTTNMRYGVEAVKEMKELVIEDGVGVIGNEAFANIKTLNTITLGKDVRKLQERVFYNCYNLTAIYNYRKTPASATSNTFEEVDKYACTIYVLAGSEEMFRSATGWKDFYSILAIGATETTVSDNKVSVEPSDNSATVTWPVSNEAASYTIDITKDGVVFCRLTFNANGQLTGIAFAPGRDGQSMAPAAVMTANGLQFTITGLTSNTQYGYSITATDAENTEVASYTGTFTTTGEIATGIDAQQSDLAPRKFIRDNQVLIMRGGKTYTIQGVEVR